jgi:translation initiation factor eIF-2B subunit delta
MTWQEKITNIVNDKLSGATALATASAQALIDLSMQSHFETTDDLLQMLEQVGEEVLRSQTGMAPLVGLYNRILYAATAQREVSEAVDTVQETAKAFISDQQRAGQEVARRGAALMAHGLTITTYSTSSTILAALKLASQNGRAPNVFCHESRPGFEGRALARELASANISVTLTADAAMFSNLKQSELVIVGADSLGEKGIVGKLGTAALATCAKWLGVPCYVLAASNKVWPSHLGSQPIKERPPEEIWDSPPDGVTVTNHYYDVTSWDAISGVVTEQGLLMAQDLQTMARERPVHELLLKIMEQVRA